jgi:hypothetical protein
VPPLVVGRLHGLDGTLDEGGHGDDRLAEIDLPADEARHVE